MTLNYVAPYLMKICPKQHQNKCIICTTEEISENAQMFSWDMTDTFLKILKFNFWTLCIARLLVYQLKSFLTLGC